MQFPIVFKFFKELGGGDEEDLFKRKSKVSGGGAGVTSTTITTMKGSRPGESGDFHFSDVEEGIYPSNNLEGDEEGRDDFSDSASRLSRGAYSQLEAGRPAFPQIRGDTNGLLQFRQQDRKAGGLRKRGSASMRSRSITRGRGAGSTHQNIKLVYTEVVQPGETTKLRVFEDFPEGYSFEVQPYSEEAFYSVSDDPSKEYRHFRKKPVDFMDSNLISIETLM